jgi:hypothetical protein
VAVCLQALVELGKGADEVVIAPHGEHDAARGSFGSARPRSSRTKGSRSAGSAMVTSSSN